MAHLLIVRGIPGAGKTRFVEILKAGADLVHASTDHIHLDSRGVYRFNPSRLSEGHSRCFRTAVRAMQNRAKLVVIDNTHTMHWEMAPYVMAGQAYGYKTAIVRLEIDPVTGADRTTHGVPRNLVDSMSRRLQDPMDFWPREYKFTDPTKEQVWDFFREFTK